jgi:deoxyribodipyrimidine photo-lyase
MTANRRPGWSFALDRAVEHARTLDRPLVILEALRCDYRWASHRLHRFIIEGMADNARSFGGRPVLYYPYVEPEPGRSQGLLEALARNACVVVADDSPAFFLRRMVRAAAGKLDVQVETVDSVGLLPLRAAERIFTTAHSFRRFLQKELPLHLESLPRQNPLRVRLPEPIDLPAGIRRKWPRLGDDVLAAGRETGGTESDPLDDLLATLSIDDLARVPHRGGSITAGRILDRFVTERIERYPDERSQPESDASSGLSPWLHFGHISVHEIFDRLARRDELDLDALKQRRVTGSRAGWWGMSEEAEAFLDELVTWREVGHNMAHLDPRCERYERLPPWARETLEEHEKDPREWIYSLDELARAETHDPLWNAAQNQLLREGYIHNYLRMLWGKKILEWSKTPRKALAAMIELNNRYALDGRDPNSTSGIFWCLGRYDRAWGPERKIFGKVRTMTSESTARKLRVKGYIEKYR